MDEKKWYALYTKPRREFKASLQLDELNITHYLPTITLLKKWSDRKKKVTEPLFKSYLFINADEKERYVAVEQNTIVKTVFFNGKPSVIPDDVIENLKKMLEKTDDVRVINGIVKGTKVKIISGPFTGIEGVVQTVSKDEQILAVSIDLLNRSVIVTLPGDYASKDLDKY
ncbi:MAG: UpxY family transcription antiterminator [Bacteroidetes bacterium]|nr:UpxY family transcription antiterminator [Bacteroidota bacterium]MBU1679471.1 UpxY family transcription antiterminator [Bacteroidota bacterium]MBU2508556.1 UpxY family transcription antiterminator [Bacteroidota bacterium]